MLLIRWGYFPPEIRQAVRPILVRYLWMVPTWCHKVYVHYKIPDGGDDVDTDALCSALPEYRCARISICAPWIDGSARQRADSVVHELLHIPLAPLQLEYEQALKRLVPEDEAPKFRETLLEQNRQRLEGTVVDLTASILSIDPAHLPSVPFVEEEDLHDAPGGERRAKSA